MKNVYHFLQLNRWIKSARIKNLGVYLLHATGRRYFGLFLDPVFSCNLRCKMCYFSDDAIRKAKQSRALTPEEIDRIAEALFHRALKLQIGCGAEPSLYSGNPRIIRLAKEKGIPYVSLTTNANRWKFDDWKALIEAGLDEVTLSLHGVTQASYEYFMTNASYAAFLESLQTLTELKKSHPSFKIRVNYTVNQDNLQELTSFFEVFRDYHFDILQIRPIQALGDTAYRNFSWEALINQYDEVIEKLRREARQRQVTFIAPDKKDLIKPANKDSNIADSTYCYVSSRTCWQDDFDLATDTYESYAKRMHLGKQLFIKVFRTSGKASKRNLNYRIQ